MKADAFVARLEKAKTTGRGQWVACCPAHPDKHPSMTVRELEDGRVLVHCFAGCSVEEILSAVGMTFDDLFPDRAIDNRVAPVRKPFPAADVLECLVTESHIVAVAASAIARGEPITEIDKERLAVATARINNGRDLVSG